jgi:hypothetical protein
LLQPAAVFFIETGEARAVEIQHAQQLIVRDEGNYNLRA